MLFKEDILTIRKKIWSEWDPINLQYFVTDLTNVDDEYDTYAVEIYGLLKDKCSEQELFNYLWRLETQHMCLEGNKERTIRFAHSLYKDWQKQTQ